MTSSLLETRPNWLFRSTTYRASGATAMAKHGCSRGRRRASVKATMSCSGNYLSRLALAGGSERVLISQSDDEFVLDLQTREVTFTRGRC